MTSLPSGIPSGERPFAVEFCDKHGGFVDEGRTRPMETGSRYRICDACVDEALRMQRPADGCWCTPSARAQGIHEELCLRRQYGDR